MTRPKIAIFGMLCCLLGACSKEPSPSNDRISSNPTMSGNASTHVDASAKIVFSNLARFNGKPPSDLMQDTEIGKEIRTIVSKSQLGCMGDIFNYMQNLEVQSDGSVRASASGSHADQWQLAFISVAPSGAINIVLQCDPNGAPKAKYQFFTNEGITAVTPSAVLNWFYEVGENDDIVTKSDGKKQMDIPYKMFVQSLPEGVAKDHPMKVTVLAQPGQMDQGGQMSGVPSSSPAVTAPAVKSEPDMRDEALKFATNFVSKHLVKCGDALILNADVREMVNGQVLGDGVRFIQVVAPSIEIVPVGTVSEADRLNGIEWFGKLHIWTKAFRTAEWPGHLSFGAQKSTWTAWLDPETTSLYQRFSNLVALSKATGNVIGDGPVIPKGLWVYFAKRDKSWQMNAGYDNIDQGVTGALNIVDPAHCADLPK